MNPKARAKQRRIATGPRQVSPGDVARAYAAVFSTEDGMVVVGDLVRRFGFTRRSTFVLDDPSGRAQARNEGQREVLLHIGFMQDVDPAEYEQSTQQKAQT